MSLDDFIRLRKGGKSAPSIQNRDTYNAQLVVKDKAQAGDNGNRSSLSKFERISTADSDSDDDEMDGRISQNSSVGCATRVESFKPKNSYGFKSFRTDEAMRKDKVESQQWRLGQNRNKSDGSSSHLRNGRVDKPYRNNSVSNIYKIKNANGNVSEIIRNNRRLATDNSSVTEEGGKIIVHQIIRPPGANQEILLKIDVTDILSENQMIDIPALPYIQSPASSDHETQTAAPKPSPGNLNFYIFCIFSN